jgi:hypothetical protein
LRKSWRFTFTDGNDHENDAYSNGEDGLFSPDSSLMMMRLINRPVMGDYMTGVILAQLLFLHRPHCHQTENENLH